MLSPSQYLFHCAFSFIGWISTSPSLCRFPQHFPSFPCFHIIIDWHVFWRSLLLWSYRCSLVAINFTNVWFTPQSSKEAVACWARHGKWFSIERRQVYFNFVANAISTVDIISFLLLTLEYIALQSICFSLITSNNQAKKRCWKKIRTACIESSKDLRVQETKDNKGYTILTTYCSCSNVSHPPCTRSIHETALWTPCTQTKFDADEKLRNHSLEWHWFLPWLLWLVMFGTSFIFDSESWIPSYHHCLHIWELAGRDIEFFIPLGKPSFLESKIVEIAFL